MIINRVPILSILSILFVFTCTPQKTAGVISETSNGATVSGTVLSSGGKPFAGSQVFLRTLEYCKTCGSGISRSVFTNQIGRYEFDSIDAGTYMLMCQPGSDSCLSQTVIISKHDSAVNVTDSFIRPTIPFSGIVKTTNGNPVRVNIMGTDINAISDNTGKFVIEGLPDTDYLIGFADAVSSSLPPSFVLPKSVALSSDTITMDTAHSVLIENFDDSDDFHLLKPFIGCGKWYILAPNTITVTPSGALNDPSAAITSIDAWRGKSFSVSASFSASLIGDTLFILGLEIGRGLGSSNVEYRWFDLSKMRSIRFMAKGSGTVHVALLTKLIYDNYNGASNFEKIITLSPQWQEYRISTEEIAPPTGSAASRDGKVWAQASMAVAEITFFSNGNLSISLDDVRIDGINSLDLIRPVQ